MNLPNWLSPREPEQTKLAHDLTRSILAAKLAEAIYRAHLVVPQGDFKKLNPLERMRYHQIAHRILDQLAKESA